MSSHTAQVAIVGAGPAGLMLGNLLLERGIDCVVLDKFTREQIVTRARAGLLEHRTVETLAAHGLANRLQAEAMLSSGCEFRSRGDSFVVDYAALYDGHARYVYPQQELVRDLLDAYVERSGDLRLAATVVDVHSGPDRADVVCEDGLRIEAEIVAGADGQYGPCRARLRNAISQYRMQHEFRWLAILASAPPSAQWTIYAQHERGFAGHLLRSSNATRFYLQVPHGDTVNDWTDERVWTELRVRLAKPGWTLNEGRLLEKRMLEMQSVVNEPMGQGRVLLLGDAAHIITPAGGKGMNLAIADAVGLDDCIAEVGTGEASALIDRYSALRLPDIWRAQEFSHALLHMMHNYAPQGEGGAFYQRLQHARLWQLANSDAYARSFAASYVGPL